MCSFCRCNFAYAFACCEPTFSTICLEMMMMLYILPSNLCPKLGFCCTHQCAMSFLVQIRGFWQTRLHFFSLYFAKHEFLVRSHFSKLLHGKYKFQVNRKLTKRRLFKAQSWQISFSKLVSSRPHLLVQYLKIESMALKRFCLWPQTKGKENIKKTFFPSMHFSVASANQIKDNGEAFCSSSAEMTTHITTCILLLCKRKSNSNLQALSIL